MPEAQEKLLNQDDHWCLKSLQNSSIMAFAQDLELKYEECLNPHSSINKKRIIGKTDEEVFSPLNVAEIVGLKRKVIHEKKSILAEVNLSSQDQSIKYILNVNPRFNHDKIIGITGVSIDIANNEVLNNEFRFQTEHSFYQPLFEHMSEGFFLGEIVTDDTRKPVDFRFVAANPIIANIMGVEREGIVGKTRKEIFSSPSPWLECLAGVALTGNPASFDVYSEIVNKSFSVNVYSPKKGLFACIVQDITERKKTEEALRMSEYRYRKLFDLMDEGFCIMEILFERKNEASDFRFLEMNSSFERQTGLANAQGKTMRELLPDVDKFWIDVYGQVALSGEPIRFENELKAINQWFDVYAFKFGPPEDMQVAVLFNNITERKVQEMNQNFLQQIDRVFAEVSCANELIKEVGLLIGDYLHVESCQFIEIDEEHDSAVINYVWRAQEMPDVAGVHRISDYASDEIVDEARKGKTVVIQNTQVDSRLDAKLFADLKIYAFISVPFLRDGKWKYLFTVNDSNTREWRNDEVQLVKELTYRLFPRLEKVRTEDALRESEERFRFVLESSHIGTWDLDLIDQTIYHSPECDRIFGYEEKLEWNYALFLKHIYQDDLDYVKNEMTKASASPDDWGFECRIVRKDKQVRWVWIAGRLVSNPYGKPRKSAGIIQDITDRKMMEHSIQERANELASANRDLEAFSYSVSHDLKSPVRSITGFCEILLEDYSEKLDEQGKEYIGRILSNAKKISEIITDLLSLSRASRQEMLREEIPFDLIVKTVIDELRQLQPQRSITFSIKENLRGFADARLMKLVFTNLIGNAWKYTSKKADPHIEVSSFYKDNQVVYFVRDNGSGFDKRKSESLFQPFKRAHSESEFPGTGIGLSIVDRIIKRHDGKIWAESEPGEGATFYFTLGK